MALHTADFSITTDAFGYGEDDLRLRPVASNRPFRFIGVTFETDDGAANPSLTVRELIEDEDEDGNAIRLDGDPLFFTHAPYGSPSANDSRTPAILQPRTEVYEEEGTFVSAADAGEILSVKRYIQVEVTDGGASKTYTGTVFYETAGDFRF